MDSFAICCATCAGMWWSSGTTALPTRGAKSDSSVEDVIACTWNASPHMHLNSIPMKASGTSSRASSPMAAPTTWGNSSNICLPTYCSYEIHNRVSVGVLTNQTCLMSSPNYCITYAALNKEHLTPGPVGRNSFRRASERKSTFEARPSLSVPVHCNRLLGDSHFHFFNALNGLLCTLG